MCIGWMKQLVCGNQQWLEIVEEFQQQMKMAAATGCGKDQTSIRIKSRSP